MIDRKNNDLTPGVEHIRQLQRRYVRYLGFAGIVGGLVGFVTGFFDQDDGDLMYNEWDKLAFAPAIAILLAALLVFGLGLLPL